MLQKLTILILGAMLISSTGCPRSAATPRTTVKAYVSALRARDFERAYALMSKDFRREYDKDEFVTHHRRNPGEVKRNIKELEAGPAKLSIKADFNYGEGSKLRLVMEEGAWKLALDPVAFYSQSTPRNALRSFVRALERRRYKILLRFVPNQWRKVMTIKDVRRLFSKEQVEDTRRLMRNLKANLDNKIERKGDQATMLYGDRYKVIFVREDGFWKIVDAD